MKSLRVFALALLALSAALPAVNALEKQPAASITRAACLGCAPARRRGVLCGREPVLDFMPTARIPISITSRLDGTRRALLIAVTGPGDDRTPTARSCFCHRNLRLEKYTGEKMDAATPGAARPPALMPLSP